MGVAMFQVYSEPARRGVFFARHEASRFGSESITPELLLIGLLRESAPEVARLLNMTGDCEEIRAQTEARVVRGMPFSTSVDLPVSEELKAVFESAEEERSNLGAEYVAPGHLLIGILRQNASAAAGVLISAGATVEAVRARMRA